jgi:DNA repair protein RecO (recombination protein O)
MSDRSRTRRTQAVILRRRDHGDADRILTVFTPQEGKLDLIAKGTRKTSSRKAGHLEPFTHVNLLVAQARTWDIITEVTTLESFGGLRASLERISQASYACELIDIFGESADDSRELWEMMLLALREIDRGQRDPQLFLRWFELHLLSLAGFQPELFHCLGCGEEIRPEANVLSLAEGGIYCPRCGQALPSGEAIDVTVLKMMRHLQRSSWASVRNLSLERAVLGALESILYRYLVLVLERQLKSVDFLRQLQRFGGLH